MIAGVLMMMTATTGCRAPEAPARPALAAEPATESTEPVVAASPTDSALRPFVPTATAVATSTPSPAPPPTMTPTLAATATPPPSPTLPPTPEPTSAPPTANAPPPTAEAPLPAGDTAATLNGIPFAAIAVLPPDVAAHVQAILRRGQELGRNPRAFSKLGDSLVLTDHYLTRFDRGGYDLGPYAALQPTVDHYAGSFGRYGVATKVGLYAAYATRPGVANAEWCPAEEHMLACEFRLHNPAVILIRIGTNDAGTAAAFEEALVRIVTAAIDSGVVPVLGTKPDRHEGDNRNNEMIRKVAADYRVPLWDFDLVAETLPGRGLAEDNAHLSTYSRNDYNDPAALQAGYPVNDLSALIILDAIRALTSQP